MNTNRRLPVGIEFVFLGLVPASVMARTAVVHLVTFDPASLLIEFLGGAYPTKGVTLASLKSLFLLYPSPSILKLCQLKRKVSARTQRAGDPEVLPDEHAFLVVLFKKISNPNLPLGLSLDSFSEFFTSLFFYPNSGARAESKKSIFPVF